jgi:hypothetical protein
MDMAPFVEYWISDGLYGSLNCVIYDHAVRQLLFFMLCTAATFNLAVKFLAI